MTQKIAIIGAGPAGLACAYSLATSGYEVEVFECDKNVGGICKSFELFDQIVDVGPHKFYTKSKKVSEFWRSFIKPEDVLSVPRRSTLFYKDKFYTYPLKGLEPLFKLGIFESVAAVLSYIKYKLFPMKGESFEDYMVNAFGKRLFQIFFKTYSKKVWDVDTTQIDKCFASQRIQKMDLFQTIKHALFYNQDDTKRTQGHITYSRFGCGVPYESMADKIIGAGGKIYNACKVTKILTLNKKACGVEFINLITGEKESKNFDVVVSTAIFKDMLESMDEIPKEVKQKVHKLSYRSTVLVYLEINPDNKLKDSWCYILSPEITSGRYSNFASWSLDMKQGQTPDIITLEYWCGYKDNFWHKSDEDLIALAKEDLLKTKLIKEADMGRGAVVRLKDSYPCIPLNYSQILDPIYEEIIQFKDLYFIGRGGTHRYNNQDHSILMGLLCADRIKGDESIDIWSVNTDPSFQEEKLVD